MSYARRSVLLAALFCVVGIAGGRAATKPAAPTDVLPEYHNTEVTALSEDCETVRLALGAAWDKALDCRAFSGYLKPWTGDETHAAAEAIVKDGARLYELVKCVDDGILSVRLARDSRDEPRLMEDVAFWRNELALAAREVTAYATAAATLQEKMRTQLTALAAQKGMAAINAKPMPWADAQREAWRKAGPMTGVRLPLEPDPASPAQTWNQTLSFEPGYLARKLHAAGDEFVSPEKPIGAWSCNSTGPGKYDWQNFNRIVRLAQERGGRFLLELPTLTPIKDDARLAQEAKDNSQQNWWIWSLYAPALPGYLASDPAATLLAQKADGSTYPYGGVQLFNPVVAKDYGAYLKAMAANLKRERLYDAVAAIHLEQGDAAILPDAVDYSDLTRQHWQEFLKARYGTIDKLNRQAGTTCKSFAEVTLPACRFPQGATGGPPVLQVDYLHFRRVWVHDYLAVKRRLVEAAFPDKLIIAEMRQFGDHDGISDHGEEKWGGFLGATDDLAQWTGVGPENETQPFMIRSVGPVGFGTRPSDSIENLFRDYLWLNFRDPGNLTRYFYDWVAHGYLDYQLGWHSIGNHWLTNRLIYQLGPTVANTAPQAQRLGMLLPRATFDLAEGPIYHEYLGWDWLLQAAKLPYTRLDERFIREGGLRKIKLEVLILPGVSAMDATLAAELTKWVAEGGLLIASRLPGRTDEYGRQLPASPLADVLGVAPDGTTSEVVAGTPLTITVPHGIFSGRYATTTDRKPAFEVLKPLQAQAETLARYESGKPAIVLNRHGKGRAVTIGYPFGAEAVQADRTSITFYRTYTGFVREPQLVARTAWLRDFIVERLGFRPDYGVDQADVERLHGKEADAMGLSLPKGLSQTPGDWFYVRTVGDPRPEHEIEYEHETPDMALRFFPRTRKGLDTTYLGVSTREVHYISPRGAVNMLLARHTYQCRINNPRIQAIWDVARNVPVGFERDATGVKFTLSLPSGHIMMLALSEKPTVQLFAPAAFPGRAEDEVLAACKALTTGTPPPAVANLTPGQIGPWLQGLAAGKQPVLISYGQEENKAAAEKLASLLRERLGLDVTIAEQTVTASGGDPKVEHWADALILIGNEWTNNDLAMHGAYWNWGNMYGPHLPFTATYAWPGKGRAVMSLSRRYAVIGQGGNQVGGGRWSPDHRVRPVQDAFWNVRRKLHIAANGADALNAVTALTGELEGLHKTEPAPAP